MLNIEEIRQGSVSPLENHLEPLRDILLQRFPQYGQIISRLDDTQIINLKDFWLNPKVDAHIPLPILLSCREQTLEILKKNIDSFLLLSSHQFPIEQFLQSSDEIQKLCLENTQSCLELYGEITHDWLEILNFSEMFLANIFTCIQLKNISPINMKNCITIAKSIMPSLQDKPQEKMQLILSQGDLIQFFCEKNQLDIISFLNLPNPFITYLVKNQGFWNIFFKHIPFESWPQDLPISQQVIENLSFLLHPDCQLLKTHQAILPLHTLLQADGNKVSIIMQNLPQVLKKFTDHQWTLEQLLNLDIQKFKLFVNYKPQKIAFIDDNSTLHQFQKEFLTLTIFQNLSIKTLTTIFQHPEATFYLFGNPIDLKITPILTLDELEPTILKFLKLPSIYQTKLIELNTQLASAQSSDLALQLKKEISTLQDKIKALKGTPNLFEILFIEASTILSLHFINIHIKDLLSTQPLLVLDFLKHTEALIRLSNPKININGDILIALPEDKRKVFLEYSEQIIELILEHHCSRDELLADSSDDIISRISHLP